MEKILLYTTRDELEGLIQNGIQEAFKKLPAPPSPKSETFLSRKETAEKLKISLVTLNDWTKRGITQSYLIGGRVLYKESEIEASLHKSQSVKY